jgi:PAS domain S-box-containing protein
MQERHWFDVALSSIGDAVITADLEGRITFMNPVAESLTGWSRHEAAGQALDQVFRIVNEETKAPVENPALRAMREGTIFGLANHTVLITRDGREIAIDDSGAPIRSDAGELLGAVLVFRDVSERRHAEEARALLAGIVDTSEDAIISKNLNAVVTSWNAAAERMFGYTAAEAIGQPIAALIVPPERRDEETMILTRLRGGERIEHFETERVAKDGRVVPISLTVSPVHNRQGEIIGTSKIARDITERLRDQAERAELLARERAARQLAEAASRAKDEFVAMISHEIRSPLNAILGWAQTLRHERGDAMAVERALDSIERNARTLAQLIDDLLDISRVITGKLQLKTRPVDVRRTLEAALESIRPAADAKLVAIDVQHEPRRTLVTGDPDRLQQILWNLLSNAVKFTPKHGHISVRIARLNSHLEISVRDSGQGIPADFLPYVFDRFTQANSGSTRAHGGLGLGLAIVRHLVELHGGSVSATSAGDGQGATFIIRLPVRAIEDDANDASSEKAASSVETLAFRSMPQGLRVMVVDDEQETRDLLSTVLQTHGADVHVCVSSAEALANIEVWKPNVLVSDIGMPLEDGYAFIRKVRKLSSDQRHVPAVALTAYARAEDRMQALGAGFDMHVPKPIEVAELLLVLAKLAGRHSRGE